MIARMNRVWLAFSLLAAGFAVSMTSTATQRSLAANEGKSMLLVHNVYFSLKESNDANRKKLVAACDKYLSDHPGTVFYAAGTVSDLDREVNNRDWDVGLHVIFKDRASHDAYQVAAKHLKFIEENKDTWAKVRVFDTDASSPAR